MTSQREGKRPIWDFWVICGLYLFGLVSSLISMCLFVFNSIHHYMGIRQTNELHSDNFFFIYFRTNAHPQQKDGSSSGQGKWMKGEVFTPREDQCQETKLQKEERKSSSRGGRIYSDQQAISLHTSSPFCSMTSTQSLFFVLCPEFSEADREGGERCRNRHVNTFALLGPRGLNKSLTMLGHANQP